jgi:serine/threonine-protein kinase
LAEAVDYLHEHRLVHRDLKPANILLEGSSPGWKVTLTDFGLVRSLSSSQVLSQSSAIIGTPAYMAPEQADSRRWGEITSLTDIYALGVVVYQMLSGRLPFEGESTTLLHAHAYNEPVVPLELIPELGEDLIALLLKALAKPPDQRFPSAEALVKALRQLETQRAQRQTQQTKLEELLAQAKTAREKSNWFALNQLCLQILERDRSHPDALQLMAEALAGLQREQAEEAARRKRQQRYEQGEQALKAQDWDTAIAAFEQVAAENPDFREVQRLLAQARDELTRAETYNEAIAQGEAGDWLAACQSWLQVLNNRPDYREGEAMSRLLGTVEQLLPQFQQMQQDLVHFQQVKKELETVRTALLLYRRLATTLYQKEWVETVSLAEQIVALFPGDPGTPPWLEEARQQALLASSPPDKPQEALSASPVSTIDKMIWEKDGKEMIRVPAGEFLYGDYKEKRTLPEFWIDKTPVTNAEYARFIAETKQAPPEHWKGKEPSKDTADHPVVNVSWNEAVAYAKWAGKRLPTEEEWEKAARGVDGQEYPWGNRSPTSKLCNFGGHVRNTTPVGQYSPQGDSPYGCVDMSGNVWEWTASKYDKSSKALRGGSWHVEEKMLGITNRNYLSPDRKYDYIGFRCVGSL